MLTVQSGLDKGHSRDIGDCNLKPERTKAVLSSTSRTVTLRRYELQRSLMPSSDLSCIGEG